MSELQLCTKCGTQPATSNDRDRLFFDEKYQDYCFEDSFWARHRDLDQATPDQGHHPVLINGQHFLVKPYNHRAPKHILGMGGAEYRIRLNSGELLVTNDLWSQGPVPERWLSDFPDNARFEPLHVVAPAIDVSELDTEYDGIAI